MAKRTRDAKAILRTIERSNRRSSLFWWLVEHHDDVLAAAKRERIDWVAFCAEAADRGLTDTRGRQPSERNARETWRQARRVVAAARAAETAKRAARPGTIYPSRTPRDWRPEAIKQMAAAVGSKGSAAAPGAAVSGNGTALIPVRAGGVPAEAGLARRSVFASPDDSPVVQEVLLVAQEQLEQADWYLGIRRKRRKG